MPLFGKDAIKIPVSVVTDADPQQAIGASGTLEAVYPAPGDVIEPSDNTKAMKSHEDEFVKVFFDLKTFEYDFAIHEANRTVMLTALKDLHPKIGAQVEVEVSSVVGDAAKATALFRGMFERPQNNVQKGRFAQALAARIEDDQCEVVVPEYIQKAIEHVVRK